MSDHMDEETEWVRRTASRSQKKEDEVQSVEKLLELLYLLLPKEDLLNALYSKRYRKEVWNIVERMMSDDYVESCNVASSNGDILRELRKEISLLADCQKRLSEYEKKYGVPWHHSSSYPLPHDSISDKPYFKYELAIRLIKVELPALSRMQPSKCASNDMTVSPDVVSLFLGDDKTPRHLVSRTQTGGEQRIVVKPDTFRNKYVLVLCINVPVLFPSYGFQSLLNLCNELYSVRGDDIKMVMVAGMNILVDTEQAFNHLFSGFPTSCLAVPYEDWDRREQIWKLLNGGAFQFQCFVYDTNGSFLKSFCVNDYSMPCGAEAFPFTEDVVQKVLTERLQLRKDGLESLLRPYESSHDVVVYEFNSPQEQRRISEVIRYKHVGLYVCCEGKLIWLLRRLYELCKLKHQEFEIVVLYLPLIDPHVFKEKINGLLQKHNVRGWWCLPFNNSVSLRFWGLTRDYDCSSGFLSNAEGKDKVIIVGPDGKILDMYGGEVIKRRVGNDVYPFTRKAFAKKKKEEVVKEVCLESLLGRSKLFQGNNPNVTISADELLRSKKKIIIYMGRVKGISYDFEGLVSQYSVMKDRGAEFEVVFVEYDPLEREVDDRKLFSAMPWYIHCPGNRTWSPLAKKLKQLFQVESLVGFGEDGHICSVKPLGTAGLCLDDTLEDDIYRLFQFDQYSDI